MCIVEMDILGRMTKGDIDRLGQRIGSSESVNADDLLKLQEYRQTFQDPISRVFNFLLNVSRKIDRQCIVTFRIKRIDTIVEKLHRFCGNPNGDMRFSRMWDIAGCRCILNTPDTEKLYGLVDAVINEYGKECKIKDSIKEPRPSGYRSIHIYVKDKPTGKYVEIQIRNKEQHNWATLVEIVDLLYGTKVKEGDESSNLGEFLSLYSHASSLNDDAFSKMLRIGRKKKIFEKMSSALTGNYLNIRKQWLSQRQKGNFFVITANKNGSEIVSFPSFEEAECAYYEKYRTNNDSNIVLTHLQMPDFEQISMAYSNYVLAMHAFFDDYRVLVSNKIIECIREGKYRGFLRYYRIYTSNVRCHFDNLQLEVKSIESCNNDPSISKNHINKWVKEIGYRLSLWLTESNDFIKRISKETQGSRLKKWFVRNRFKHLAKVIKNGQKS